MLRNAAPLNTNVLMLEGFETTLVTHQEQRGSKLCYVVLRTRAPTTAVCVLNLAPEGGRAWRRSVLRMCRRERLVSPALPTAFAVESLACPCTQEEQSDC